VGCVEYAAGRSRPKGRSRRGPGRTVKDHQKREPRSPAIGERVAGHDAPQHSPGFPTRQEGWSKPVRPVGWPAQGLRRSRSGSSCFRVAEDSVDNSAGWGTHRGSRRSARQLAQGLHGDLVIAPPTVDCRATRAQGTIAGLLWFWPRRTPHATSLPHDGRPFLNHQSTPFPEFRGYLKTCRCPSFRKD